MSVGDAVRAEVWARDEGWCQFLHREPTPATELAHFQHQGMGGRPEDADENQPDSLACACRECHEKLHARYRWTAFDPMDGAELLILAPNGKAVPERELWFYVRWVWAKAEGRYLELQQDIASERRTAWSVAQRLAWFKETGVSRAISDEMADYLDIGASLGLSSAEVKQRVRVYETNDTDYRGPLYGLLSIDVADRLRKVPEEEVQEVARWFMDLPPSEAWSRFHERYPGKERTRVYRTFTGTYTETRAASEDDLLIVPGAIVVKGGSVIAGTRKEAIQE